MQRNINLYDLTERLYKLIIDGEVVGKCFLSV